MKGYKAFYKKSDGTLFTNGMSFGSEYIFNVGWTYKKDDSKIEICGDGFHYCNKLYDTIQYYPLGSDVVYCEIESDGKIIEADNKSVCSKMFIVRELEREDIENILISEGIEGVDFNEISQALYESRFCFESQAIFQSHRIKDAKCVFKSNGISNSVSVYNSNLISNAYGIYQSNSITCGLNAYNSKDNFDTINTYEADLILKSENINNSKQVYSSKNVFDSYYIKESSNIESSYLVLGCKNIINSLAIRKCYNLSNCLFCYDIGNKEYCIFNKQVSRDYFIQIMEAFHNIGYINMAMIENDKNCRASLRYKPDWASTINETFFDVAFRLEEFDRELFETILTVPEDYLKEKHEVWKNENKGL